MTGNRVETVVRGESANLPVRYKPVRYKKAWESALRVSISVLCLIAATSVAVLAQQSSPDPFLDHLAGEWILHGTIAGKETTHDVKAEWILNHEYIQLHEISREKNASGRPAYEAIVLLGSDPKSKQYACLWLDTTTGGGLVPDGIGHGNREGDQIPFLFVSADGTKFHNTFIYTSAADTWQWVMDNEAQGKLEPFGRVSLRRK